jgi:hypothetical protein
MQYINNRWEMQDAVYRIIDQDAASRILLKVRKDN